LTNYLLNATPNRRRAAFGGYSTVTDFAKLREVTHKVLRANVKHGF
jgi:hypothetical protein